jgi:pimeloyl-ACP methyl ester carboxylesterase
VHGWPELSISWRHQLPCFADLGFRAIAPDMRGYGRSSVYARHEDYALEQSVRDMIELLDALGREKAIWVGHDWGSPVVWSLASHHRSDATAWPISACPTFRAASRRKRCSPWSIGPSTRPINIQPASGSISSSIRRTSTRRAAFEENVANTAKAMFRKGSASGKGKPSRTALVRRDGGWFGVAGQAPDLPMDTDVLTDEDFNIYVGALTRNGFFGPDSWYMNHGRNLELAAKAVNGGMLEMPVLFLHGEYDYTCETVASRLAEPMRQHCRNLTEVIVRSGHWMAQEKPVVVNAALAKWLAAQFPDLWG